MSKIDRKGLVLSLISLLLFISTIILFTKTSSFQANAQSLRCPVPNCDQCGKNGFCGTGCPGYPTCGGVNTTNCPCSFAQSCYRNRWCGNDCQFHDDLNVTNGCQSSSGQNNPSPTSSNSQNNGGNPINPTANPLTTGEQQVNAIKNLFNLFYNLGANNPTQNAAQAPTQPSVTPPSPPASSFTSLRAIFQEVESRLQVPSRILEAVLLIESPDVFNYSSDQVNAYSQPGAVIPGCGPNECSATGPMQMTIGVDSSGSPSCARCCYSQCLSSCPNQWGTYGSSVNTYGGNPQPAKSCNLRDNIYAAALKLKTDSGATSTPWTQSQVYQAAQRYYGSCSDSYRYARLGGRTYCEFVWWYYTSGP